MTHPQNSDEREALLIFLPVICQNGHKALATYRWDSARMDYIFESVPRDEQCKCPKHNLGQGYKQDGAPFIRNNRPKVSLSELLTLVRKAWCESNDTGMEANYELEQFKPETKAILNYFKQLGVQFDEQD